MYAVACRARLVDLYRVMEFPSQNRLHERQRRDSRWAGTVRAGVKVAAEAGRQTLSIHCRCRSYDLTPNVTSCACRRSLKQGRGSIVKSKSPFSRRVALTLSDESGLPPAVPTPIASALRETRRLVRGGIGEPDGQAAATMASTALMISQIVWRAGGGRLSP